MRAAMVAVAVAGAGLALATARAQARPYVYDPPHEYATAAVVTAHIKPPLVLGRGAIIAPAPDWERRRR